MTKPCKKCGATDRNAFGRCRPCRKIYDVAYENPHNKRRKRKTHETKDTKAKWHLANPGRGKATQALWREKNSEYLKLLRAKWRASHLCEIKALRHKRRAYEKKADGSFTAADVCAIRKRQRGKCVVCRIDISKRYHIDHIMPLALGGSNDKSNIQLLCPFCNMSKQDKHPIDFMQSRGFLL